MSIEGIPLVFTILADIDFNAPTAFGIPLGTLFIFWMLMNMNKQSQAQSGTKTVVATAFTSPNTMDVHLNNEVTADVVLFQHSEATFGGGQVMISYTVKIKESGTFVIAGGKVKSGNLSRSHCGTRQISGDAGDVISGAINCRGFTSGIWGVGAFRSASQVPKT
ncbi:MAG TPA: hypothetical protein EYM79_06895 [Planctomycetes bacterium]|nr:hypothetical protein [Planctomycetaceae bacterium]HIN54021.1 hypothetical protein [Planctomycetota bacterium]